MRARFAIGVCPFKDCGQVGKIDRECPAHKIRMIRAVCQIEIFDKATAVERLTDRRLEVEHLSGEPLTRWWRRYRGSR